MHSARPEDLCAPHCPGLIREALDLIAGKWTVPIFFALHRAETPLRYADLRRRLEPVTPKDSPGICADGNGGADRAPRA